MDKKIKKEDTRMILDEEKARAEYVARYNELCQNRDIAIANEMAIAKQEIQNTAEFQNMVNEYVEQMANARAEAIRAMHESTIAWAEQFLKEEPTVDQPIEVR